MKKMLFSIHDAVTDTFAAPFSAINEQDAHRSVMGAMKPGNMLFENDRDYSVYFVGEFDMDSGEIQDSIPVLSVRCSSLKTVLAGIED